MAPSKSVTLLNLSQLVAAAQANFDDACETTEPGSVERSHALTALAAAHSANEARKLNVQTD
jgi:hypothetical protein